MATAATLEEVPADDDDNDVNDTRVFFATLFDCSVAVSSSS